MNGSMRSERLVRAVLCSFVIATTITLNSCGGGGGGGLPFIPAGDTTGNSSVVTAVQMSAPLANCPSGGITVEAGIDDNGNGVLDAAEVDSTQYVCNGANGADGLSVLVRLTDAGANCANGGTAVNVGLDSDKNAYLDDAEFSSTDYICNGANGTNGTDGTNGTNGTDGNNWPIANAGPDQKVASAGIQVTLDGSNSSDPDGSTPTCSWAFTTRPVGSMAALSSSIASSPTFTPDKAGAYVLSLVVSDGQANSLPDTVVVRVGMLVPDTGQTRWYSTAFGDDGDYSINPMSYTDNGDGTILDNVTGLTWQKCSMGQSGLDCATGTAAIYNWFRATGTYDALSNPTTTNVCGSLGTGWRLPTDFELMTIVDYGTYNSSAINTAYFPNTPLSSYWSSTSYAVDATLAWYVNFSYGYTDYNMKASSYHVRCVRGQ